MNKRNRKLGLIFLVMAIFWAGFVFAAGGNETSENGNGAPPSIEAPKAPNMGSAVADGGGSYVDHLAWTVGSGPGNDVGFDQSEMSSKNEVSGTIQNNSFDFSAANGTLRSAADLDSLDGLTGQISITQNAGANAVTSAGVGVTFITNQGMDNPAVVTHGSQGEKISINAVYGDTGNLTDGTASYESIPYDIGQSTYNDGLAAASGGGMNTTHEAWTVGSGTGVDTGFANSQLLSANTLSGTVTGNNMNYAFSAEGNLSQAAQLTNVAALTGQVAVVQNAGNNAVVGGGTSVNFISNVTAFSGPSF